MSRAKAGAAEEAAAADGGENSVEIWHFFQKLLCRRCLTGDDSVVIIRVDQDRARLGLDFGRRFFAGGHGGLAEGDFAPIVLDRLAFYARSIPRHDDPSLYAAPGCCTGDGSAMVAAGLGNDAMPGLFIGQGKYGVCRPADFE